MINLCDTYIIKRTEPLYKELDKMSHLSKNLYNSALYNVRQYYFETKKYLNYASNVNNMTAVSQPDYIALPRKVSQWICRQVDMNMKSFFGLLKAKQSGAVTHLVRLPHYLPKDGRYSLTFTSQAISNKLLKQGLLKLSGCENTIRIKHRDIRQVKVIPCTGYFKIQVLYQVDEPEWSDNGIAAGMDIGVNNLATVGGNTIKPFIINGRPLKSINQYYNKTIAELKSRRDLIGVKDVNSRRMAALARKRQFKMNDYMHKASRLVVNHLVSNKVSTLVIGHNNNWKQDITLGKKANQTFVMIPMQNFIHMVEYKCKLAGIKVITREESYTSKASFIDNDPIPDYGDKNIPVFAGRRINRGLYKSRNGKLVNADLNGALNILRKEIPNTFEGYGIEVCSTPMVLTIK